MVQGTQIATTPATNDNTLVGVTIPRSGDGGGWVLSWSPDSVPNEVVDVFISGPVTDAGQRGGVYCQSIPDSDGKVTVPYALLHNLGTASGDTGGITVYRTGYSIAMADNAYVRITSRSRIVAGGLVSVVPRFRPAMS